MERLHAKPNKNIRYLLFVICYSLFGHWETFHGTSLHWSLVTDHWSLITDHWLLITVIELWNI